jgi:hypothetical protein
MANPGLPYRGAFGGPRPPALAALALPPSPMPSHLGGRPLKAWRYVGVYGPELMLCLAAVRIGPARQCFWAVWDRTEQRLYERTRLGRGGVALSTGRATVADRAVEIELELDEGPGIETVCASADGYAWTRKQGGIPVRGTVTLDGRPRALEARGLIDDTAAYYPRHTTWSWSAGVGHAEDGRELAWNLVAGVNDPPANSERTVWVAGQASEAEPVAFAADLSAVGELRFASEAVRAANTNLLIVRSAYRQPFGTFSGVLPGGVRVAEGYGVMEYHDARW